MPELKTSLCTKEFLLKLKDNVIPRPLLQQLTKMNVANPPPLQVLHELLCESIEANIHKMSELQFGQFKELRRLLIKGKADKAWYIDMIATLTEGHHVIFERDYVPEPKSRPFDEGFQVANPDGFFTGLPMSSKKRTANGSLLLTEEQKQERNLRRIQMQQESMKLRIVKQEKKIEQTRQRNAEAAAKHQPEHDRLNALFNRAAEQVAQRERQEALELSRNSQSQASSHAQPGARASVNDQLRSGPPQQQSVAPRFAPQQVMAPPVQPQVNLSKPLSPAALKAKS